MRVSVGMIVEALAAGRIVEDLLSDFRILKIRIFARPSNIAANLVQGREFPLAS